MKRQIFGKQKVLFFLVLILGMGLRLYGLNWDQGFHLHPDERFLTMVGTAIRWPKNVFEYFDSIKQYIPDNPDDSINLSKNISKVSKIHINLKVDVDDDGKPDVTLNTDVNLRNYGLPE